MICHFYQWRRSSNTVKHIFGDHFFLVLLTVLTKIHQYSIFNKFLQSCIHLGPVVQSVVSLMSSLRVISLTVLVGTIYNILKFFAEKM